MAFRLSTSARNAACDGIVDLLDVGGAGQIRIRTGSQPTNVGDADTGTLLGTCPLSATAFGASSSGTATANTITSDSSADASGTAGHFRMYSGGGTCIADGTCGLGTGDLSFDNNVIVAGGVIAITSFTVSVPIQ